MAIVQQVQIYLKYMMVLLGKKVVLKLRISVSASNPRPWVDTDNPQLYLFTGTGWVLVGPNREGLAQVWCLK